MNKVTGKAKKRNLVRPLKLTDGGALEAPSFAAGLNFYKGFWVFFIGCFLGVIIETVWCIISRGHFESRQGLIYGPFNLVYGGGALIMTLALYWLRERSWVWTFLGSMVIGGAFEYLCSLVQEWMFGSVSWEYSQTAFNLAGRTNLFLSVCWGVLGLWWMKSGYPVISKWIEKIPNRIGKSLSWILVVFMIFNTIMSGLAVGRWSQRHQGIPAANGIEQFLDTYYPDDLLKKVYPNMAFTDEIDRTPPPRDSTHPMPLA